MTVRIVTDSTCDLPDSTLQKFNITMVPASVVWQGRAYKDRVELSHDQLFAWLEQGDKVPTTAAPPPAYFSETFRRLAEETKEIVSLHVTSEHSAVYDVAQKGRDAVANGCRIEVIDTRLVSMAMGLVVLDAARTANRGASMEEVLNAVRNSVSHVREYAAFDTMRYLTLGGRVNRVVGNLGTTLKIRPILTITDGRIKLAGLARTYGQAIERVKSFVEKVGRVEEWSVVYSTDRAEAERLAEYMTRLCPMGEVPITRLGPALGVHGGPGSVVVAVKLKAT
jgi:DegV family protein with EDD domain